jgi:hypothetical protein
MNTNKRSIGDDEPWGYFTDDINDGTFNISYSNNSIVSTPPPVNSFSSDFIDRNHGYGSNKIRKIESNMESSYLNTSSDNVSALSEDGNYNSDTTTSSHKSSSSSASSSRLSSIPSSSSVSNDDNDKVIICRMDNILSSTSCRSFSDLTSKGGYGRWEDVTIGLRGFRIVQTESRGEEAEFCVILTTNDNEYCCWKPYSCFAEIAEACKAVHNNVKEKLLFERELGHEISDEEWHEITNKNTLYRPREFDILLSYIYDSFTSSSSPGYKQKSKQLLDASFSGNLNNSLKAWQNIVSNRSIWNKKNLEVTHLIKESSKLDNFLKQLLFDINSPSILIEFMTSTH